MLIATLPTLTGASSRKLSEKIIRHPCIDAVRYNTGGDSPYEPRKILKSIKPITDSFKKTLYVDLEGRQIRVARWSPYSKGSVILNRDFSLELPGIVHFRGAGWFDIVNAEPEKRKIFFKRPRKSNKEYYLGESQSAHIIAKKFKVLGYLAGFDFKYLKAACDLGICNFMLSFVESMNDVAEFYGAYSAYSFVADCEISPLNLGLKIESREGIKFVQNQDFVFVKNHLTKTRLQLIAARDDLFLGFFEKRAEFFEALKTIVGKDPEAIVASRLLSGLEYPGEITIGDMADIALMRQFGYRNFMLSDELSHYFESAMRDWQKIIEPLLVILGLTL